MKVIFRKFKKENDIIAFLPEVEANAGYVMSYQHVGQHGEADQSTIVHCFGYGKSVKDTMFNVLHGRIFRASYTVFYEG